MSANKSAKKTDCRCSGKTKAGKPCRAAAMKGGIFCLFHTKPELASTLGRKGGRRNRQQLFSDEGELPKLESAAQIRDLVKGIVTGIYTGRLNPRLGGLAPMLKLLAQVLDYADLEQRMQGLEQQIEELRSNELKKLADGDSTERHGLRQ